jgi:UDP-N-acetylmuramoyl-tripeptide--D-alanyl-D-alanine ligase
MATPIPENRARFTADAITRVTGGARVVRAVTARPELEYEGVTSDSRAVRRGCVFVALRGETFDGHAFAARAIEAGAGAVVVLRGRGAELGESARGRADVVEVDDTLVALGDLARDHLARWRAAPSPSGPRRVVAVTGSAGKTTTKELTAALLRAVAPCHATAGNLNNRIGVPAVIFALEEAHRFAVVEMGMSVPGEIAAVASIARPDVAIVTNVGVAHAEGVGGREGVLREKRAVYEALLPDGVAIVNADDDFSRRAAEASRGGTASTFGRDASATYRLVARAPRGPAGAEVTLARLASSPLVVTLPLPGEAAAIDLAAALAAQEAASGVVLEAPAIDAALARVHLPGRAQVLTLGDGTLVVDDTYNANPGSVRAALAALAEIGPGRRRVAVLGEMKELGDLAAGEHEALGAALVEAGVALAIGCGGLVGLALARAEALAGPGFLGVPAASTEEAALAAASRIEPGDVVLVKGSRSVGAERVVLELVRTRGERTPESLPSPGNSATSVPG